MAYREAQTQFNTALEALALEVRLRHENLDAASDYFSAVQNLVQRIPAAWPQIREWCFWQKVRSEGMKLGLEPVIAKLESPDGDVVDIPALFERSFRRDLFFATIESESSLREFFGREQNERIDRFRNVDEKIAALTRSLIRARLSPRPVGRRCVVTAASDPTVASCAGAARLLRTEPQVRLMVLSISNDYLSNFHVAPKQNARWSRRNLDI